MCNKKYIYKGNLWSRLYDCFLANLYGLWVILEYIMDVIHWLVSLKHLNFSSYFALMEKLKKCTKFDEVNCDGIPVKWVKKWWIKESKKGVEKFSHGRWSRRKNFQSTVFLIPGLLMLCIRLQPNTLNAAWGYFLCEGWEDCFYASLL